MMLEGEQGDEEKGILLQDILKANGLMSDNLLLLRLFYGRILESEDLKDF